MSLYANNRQALPLLLATLLLRASIPDGYMPASPDSGLLFELCPSGVPAGFIQALTGSDAHKHHHESDASEAQYDASDCPIGHMLSSAAAFDDLWQVDAISQIPELIDTPALIHISRAPTNHRSRGPPA